MQASSPKEFIPKASDAARIAEAYRLVYSREPSSKELEIGLEFLKANADKPGYSVAGVPGTAWREYAHALLSSSEFEFVN